MKKNCLKAIGIALILSSTLGTSLAYATNTNSQVSTPTVVTKENKVNVEQYEKILTKMFENKAFENAWNDYKKIISEVIIGSEYVAQSTGTSFEDFNKKGLVKTQPTEVKLGKEAIAKVYRYTTEEPFNEALNQNPGTADLIMVYNSNKLVYVGVINNSFNLTQENLINQEKVESLVKEKFDFSKLDINSPIVTSFGTTLINNHQYSCISLLSGKAENPIVEYFALVEGKFDYITSKTIKEEVEKSFILNINAVKDYIENDSNEFYKTKSSSNSSR